MTYRECYEFGAAKLTRAKVPEAELDARLLLEFVCRTNRSDLLVHGDREVTQEQITKYQEMIGLRAERIPLQQITGVQEFMGLSFGVNEHVLIPRQDTEILVEQALKVLKPGMSVLDMCTGSGCILISLLALSKECTGTGVDLSEKALEVAKQNGRNLLGESFVDDAKQPVWIQSDLFEKVSGKYDMIVSNPPYIPTKVVEGLMPEVRDHEPVMALDGRDDGLYFYRKIAEKAPQFLKGEGRIFLEIGYDQGKAVATLLEDNHFTEVKVIQDYAGLDRVVTGRRKD